MRRYDTARPPTGLMVNLLRRPEAAEPIPPPIRFSWQMNDAAPNQAQTAWQILVVADPPPADWENAAVWNSGPWDPARNWTAKPESIHVPYAGPPLEPGRRYWWKVRTWNNRGEISPWSEPQAFRVAAAPPPLCPTARQHLVETSEAPAAFVPLSPTLTFVDFGRAAFGALALTLEAPAAAEVRVRLGEVRRAPFAIHRNPGGSRRYREIRLPIEAGRKTYRLTIEPDPRNTAAERDEHKAAAILMPPERGEVLPFRYAEIEGPVQPRARNAVRRLTVHYPFDETAAAFRSSNRVLDDVWELCRYSIKATSFCGLHVDGDRERIPYEADAYINQLGQYACDREYALSRATHEYLVHHPTWPTEWVLFSVLNAWEDYAWTGDISSAERFYPDLEAKTLVALADADGLISTAGGVPPEVLEAVHFHPAWTMRDIVDWPEAERDGHEMRPVNTVVNAFHYRALVLMGRLAQALGRDPEAQRWTDRARRARDAILRRLVSPETGLFIDGEGSRHSSLHANIFPLAFGIPTPDMHPALLRFIRSRGMACSVYAAQFLLEALYRAGDSDTALALLTATAERSWAHWIYDVDSTITLEAWDDRFKPNQDWNHAWGAAPANIIPRFLVGVRPLTPGFGRILIAPQPGPLRFFEARIPTIRGPVEVRLLQEPRRNLELECEIPANTTARIVLPGWAAAGTPAVRLDGRPAIAEPRDGNLVLDPVGSGRHSIACRRNHGP